MTPLGPLRPAAGITVVTTLALARPARLGATRLVAVDGPSGSGKTRLAAPLAAAIAARLGGIVLRPARGTGGTPGGAPTVPRVAVVSTDLLATWERPLDWWPLLDEHLLAPLSAGRAAELPVVQWISGNPRPGGAIQVPLVDVLVLEGVSSGRAAVADRLSLLAWVEVADRAVRLERAVARDGEAMRPFLQRWQSDEDAHFASDRTRDRADVLIRPAVRAGDGRIAVGRRDGLAHRIVRHAATAGRTPPPAAPDPVAADRQSPTGTARCPPDG